MLAHRPVRVLPADVGVFRSRRLGPSSRTRRPRRRAGVPGASIGGGMWAASSPPTRGCSAERGRAEAVLSSLPTPPDPGPRARAPHWVTARSRSVGAQLPGPTAGRPWCRSTRTAGTGPRRHTCGSADGRPSTGRGVRLAGGRYRGGHRVSSSFRRPRTAASNAVSATARGPAGSNPAPCGSASACSICASPPRRARRPWPVIAAHGYPAAGSGMLWEKPRRPAVAPSTSSSAPPEHAPRRCQVVLWGRER